MEGREDEGVVGADRAAARQTDGRGGPCAEAGRHHVRGLEGRHAVRPTAVATARRAGDNVAGAHMTGALTSASSDHGRVSAAYRLGP